MELLSSVLVAVLVAVLAWVGFAIKALIDQRSDRDRALDQDKRETYRALTKTLFDMLRLGKEGHSATEMLPADFESQFFELARDMTVYASDDVLRLWVMLKTIKEGEDPLRLIAIVGKLLEAVRVDLGHKNSEFKARELLSTFITDLHELDLPSID